MENIQTQQEYDELKKIHDLKVRELCALEENLIRWERTRPEAIEMTRKMLMPGWEVDEETGETYSTDPKNGLIMLGKMMMENNNRC